MKKFFLGLALASTCLAPATSLAADLEPPPPVDDLRPSYAWSGPYVGGFASIIATDGHYVARAFCGCPSDPEMGGVHWNGGLLAGWNYQFNDSFVLGIEGDWAFGGQVGDNNDPAEMTYLDYDNIATVRARAGWADNQTLFYLTGGVAFVDTAFGGLVGPAAENIKDSSWETGWVIGGGIEHAFAENFHGRLEYMYIGMPDNQYTLVASDGSGGTVDMRYGGVHTIRAGLTYNFSW